MCDGGHSKTQSKGFRQTCKLITAAAQQHQRIIPCRYNKVQANRRHSNVKFQRKTYVSACGKNFCFRGNYRAGSYWTLALEVISDAISFFLPIVSRDRFFGGRQIKLLHSTLVFVLLSAHCAASGLC